MILNLIEKSSIFSKMICYDCSKNSTFIARRFDEHFAKLVIGYADCSRLLRKQTAGSHTGQGVSFKEDEVAGFFVE